MGAIKGRQVEPAVCQLCGYSSKRLTTFEEHLTAVHGITGKELWISQHGEGRCGCGCGSETKWLGWGKGFSQFITGHNASLYAHMDPDAASEVVKKRTQTLRDSISTGKVKNWALGRCKDTDEIIAGAATKRSSTLREQFSGGHRVPWSRGLTKETDERVRKVSETMKQGFSTGELVPWSKGRTKGDDPRILEMSRSVSVAMRKESLRRRLDHIKRLKEDEIRSRIEGSNTLQVVGGLEGYINDASPAIRVRCSACGSEFYDSLRRLQRGRCYVCQPTGSAAQGEITNFISSLGVEAVRNDRSRLSGIELDTLVPSRNFAVEYNGLYWHCDLHKSSMYHENKSRAAREVGITLFHVFEDDWRDRRGIVESMITHRLGLTPRKVGSRSLSLAKLDRVTRESFFNENHIDGDVAATVAWGLFLGTELLAAMSVRKPFHRFHSDHYEVARFCTKKMVHVHGALQKLTSVGLEFSKANEKQGLITYVDTRFGTGKGYESSGYERINVTPPRFWWTDFDSRFNRFKFRADPTRNMSETDVASEMGVVKIWGCSNYVYKVSWDH